MNSVARKSRKIKPTCSTCSHWVEIEPSSGVDNVVIQGLCVHSVLIEDQLLDEPDDLVSIQTSIIVSGSEASCSKHNLYVVPMMISSDGTSTEIRN